MKLSTLPIVLFSATALLATGLACGKGATEAPEGSLSRAAEPAEQAEQETPRQAAAAAALAEAFAADENCQLLVACCAGLGDSTWATTLAPFCEQLEETRDFAAAVRGGVNLEWQARGCENRVASLAGMGSGGNPLPEACRKP